MSRAKCRECRNWCITDSERRTSGWVDRRGWAITVRLGMAVLICDRCLPALVHEATKDKAA
jgi:hypothetical protein